MVKPRGRPKGTKGNVEKSAPPTTEETAPLPIIGVTPMPAELNPGGLPQSSTSRGAGPAHHLERSPSEHTTTKLMSHCSTASVQVRKLTAQAQHARRLLELERKENMLERATAELELQAELAAIDDEDIQGGSRAGSRVNRHATDTAVTHWLDSNVTVLNPTNVPNVVFRSQQCSSVPLPNMNLSRPPPVSRVAASEPCPRHRAPPDLPVYDRVLTEPCADYNNSFPEPCAGQRPTLDRGVGYFRPHPEQYVSLAHQEPSIVGHRAPADLQHDIALNTGPALCSVADNNFNKEIFNSAPNTPNNDTLTCITQLAKAIGNQVSNQSNQRRLKSWNIKLPSFSGNCLDWLPFKRVYEDTKPSYSAAENLARLSYALQGAAREAVRMLLVSAQDPDDVIQILELTFARPEVIVLQELAAIRTLPKMDSEGKDINTFACRVRNCVATVKFLNKGVYLQAPELLNTLVGKLTPLLRIRWADYATSQSENEKSLDSLARFLDREMALLASFGFLSEPATFSANHDNVKSRVREKVHVASTARSAHEVCLFCQKSHRLTDCQQFKNLTVDSRWNWVKEHKLCHRCLTKGSHRYKTCNAKSLCKEDGCKYRHHELLHNHLSGRATSAHVQTGLPSSIPSTLDNSNCHSDLQNVTVGLETKAHTAAELTYASSTFSQSSLRPLLKMIAVTVSGPAGSVDSYALLDDGSTATLIDSEITKLIGAKGPEALIQVDCVGGLSKEAHIQYIDFHIKGRHSTESHLIRKARSISNLGIARQHICIDDVKKYKHLADLSDVLCYEQAKPMIIIGTDNWHLTLSQAVRKGTRSQPVAARTALGWVLFGFGCSKSEPVELINHHSVIEFDNDDQNTLEKLIKEQYKLDSIGIIKKDIRSVKDEQALKILKDTVRRLPSGHFEAGLLWRSDKIIVPDSYNLALSRFKSLERKMAKDRGYAELYKLNIRNMIEKGYAEEWDKAPLPSAVCWYIPHFGVTNSHKPGKLRVVHDAAAKTQGVSLNSLLLPGPDPLQPLLSILFRFREGRIAITADIREMFPQVKIREEDRDAQRFLWRENPNLPIKVFRMTSMMFGTASSPSTALYVKNKNASELQDRYPEAAKAIIFDHYMDDYISSVNHADEAARLAADIIEVHRNAGFEMRAWISNNTTALSQIPEHLLLDPKTSVDLGGFQQNIRTLGLIWQPAKDIICFDTNFADSVPEKLTKRVALSHLMRIFDPIGFLAPLVVRGRILFQQVWRSGVEWDNELTQVQRSQWKDWCTDLLSVKQLKIPRWYSCELNPVARELHVFSDASELAFAAVAYWRFVYANGNVHLALISSKVRVTPLSYVTIPRLELQGALIAARLAT